MLDLQTKHLQAMECADRALIAQRIGDCETAKKLFYEAFVLEKDVALALDSSTEEPTRSIMFRSAATLALDCDEKREAEKLVCRALAGDPPAEFVRELKELHQKITFYEHLSLRGIELLPDEFQLSLDGNSVGPGIVRTDLITDRIQATKKLVLRTRDRKRNIPFNDSDVTMESDRDIETYMAVPRAACFAVTMRIGKPQRQLKLPGQDVNTTEILDELVCCLEQFNSSKEEELKARINDEAYFRNFVSLAGKLSPDGEELSMVGITRLNKGKEEAVALTKPAKQIPIVASVKAAKKKEIVEKRIEVCGSLRLADSVSKKRHQIGLVDDYGDMHTVIVPVGMMVDIVKPLWENRVVVTGTQKKKVIFLEDIRKA